jgi:MerR family transcriptional regulator, light-induced transcriptional regulator
MGMPTQDPLLKTQQVAEALGVSVSTIKRWVDAGVLRATRTVGMHRLIRHSEAVRFAHAQGLPVAALEALSAPGTTAVGALDGSLRESLVEALERGDAGRGRGLIASAYASGCGAAALSDQFIRPVMERIGHAWAAGTIDVYQEHQASLIVATALGELNSRLSRSVPADAPLAIGAAPPGDPYILAVLAGELVLRESGWDVKNLGVGLPLRSLSAAVLRFRPRLVFLCVNHLDDPEQFCREYHDFHTATAPAGAAVAVGGRALGPDLRARLVYASFGERMAHLNEFARRVAPASPRRPGTNGTVALEPPGSEPHQGG